MIKRTGWHRRHSVTSGSHRPPTRESSAESQSRVRHPCQTELLRKAQRFRRRFDLYGPPDWIDPAETILPARNMYGLHPPNVIASLFPYAVPHIVIHFAPEPLSVAWMNGLDCQDHEWGNRLIVVLPPSRSGPHPSVTRAGSCYPSAHREEAMAPAGTTSAFQEDALSAAAPNLISDEDGSMISDDSDTPSIELHGTEFSEGFISGNRSPFWIPEDEEQLPTLPENWLKPSIHSL